MSSSQKTEGHRGSTHQGSSHRGSSPGSSLSASSFKTHSKLHTQHPDPSNSDNSKSSTSKTKPPHADPALSPPTPTKPHKPPFNIKRLESGYPTGSPASDKPGHIISHQFFGIHYKNAYDGLSHHPLNWITLKKHSGPERDRLIIARTNYLSQPTFSYHPRPSREITRLINIAKEQKRYSMEKPEKPLKMPLS